MKTSIFYYCAFAFVVLSGVLFGLDWQPATLSPMPPIQVVALPPPPPPVKPLEPVAAPVPAAPPVAAAPTRPAAPRAAGQTPVAPNPPGPVAVAPANPPIVQAPKPSCDVAACAAAYRSFRESDCTFNPSFGPRQLCTKGVVPSAAIAPPATPAASAAPDAPPASIVAPEPNARTTAQPAATSDAQPAVKCNISACAAAYRTFTESDCTFMASGGLRKLCTK